MVNKFKFFLIFISLLVLTNAKDTPEPKQPRKPLESLLKKNSTQSPSQKLAAKSTTHSATVGTIKPKEKASKEHQKVSSSIAQNKTLKFKLPVQAKKEDHSKHVTHETPADPDFHLAQPGVKKQPHQTKTNAKSNEEPVEPDYHADEPSKRKPEVKAPVQTKRPGKLKEEPQDPDNQNPDPSIRKHSMRPNVKKPYQKPKEEDLTEPDYLVDEPSTRKVPIQTKTHETPIQEETDLSYLEPEPSRQPTVKMPFQHQAPEPKKHSMQPYRTQSNEQEIQELADFDFQIPKPQRKKAHEQSLFQEPVDSEYQESVPVKPKKHKFKSAGDEDGDNGYTSFSNFHNKVENQANFHGGTFSGNIAGRK